MRTHNGEAGFSIMEMMVTLAILTVIMGVIFKQIDLATKHNDSERSKLDVFQESRAFMDLMSRDLHEAGYPSPRNFAPGTLTANPALPSSPYAADHRAAVGLTRVAIGDLWFEGDVDGDGAVEVVRYFLDPNGAGCPCLRRSQQPKTDAAPLAQASSYQVEVQNVKNGTVANPVFYAFKHNTDGTPLTLPIDFNSDPTSLAQIDTIKAVLTVESSVRDPQTQIKPITTLVTTVRLNNCSSAQTGQFMSCF